MVTKVLFALAIVGNVALGSILVSTKSDQFKKIVGAAESISSSQKQVANAIGKFNKAVANIEAVTARVDVNVKEIENSISRVQSDIDRMQDFLRF